MATLGNQVQVDAELLNGPGLTNRAIVETHKIGALTLKRGE